MARAGEADPFVAVAEVICSICLEQIGDGSSKAIARLKCGHIFHLSCIGCEFNARGMMRCPNCRETEVGEWPCDSAFENARAARFNMRNEHHDDQNPSVGARRVDSVPNVRGRRRNRQNPTLRTRSAPLHSSAFPLTQPPPPPFPFAFMPPPVGIPFGIAMVPFPQPPYEDADPISFVPPMDPRGIAGSPQSRHDIQPDPVSSTIPLAENNFQDVMPHIGTFPQTRNDAPDPFVSVARNVSNATDSAIGPSGSSTPANGLEESIVGEGPSSSFDPLDMEHELRRTN